MFKCHKYGNFLKSKLITPLSVRTFSNNKIYNTTTNKKNGNQEKDMDIYVKKDKLLKDQEDNKIKMKKAVNETKCLVLHPVFNNKYI